MNNPGWLGATPHGRKTEDADQVSNAALKALDLLSGMLELHFHVRQPSTVRHSTGPAFADFTQELVRLNEERVLLKNAPDNDYRMGSQGIHDGVPAKPAEIVRTNDRVRMQRPNVIHPCLELQ